MPLILRRISEKDVEPATQCGLAAWTSAIPPLLDDFHPSKISQIEHVFRSFLTMHCPGNPGSVDPLILADMGGVIAGFYCLEVESGELTDFWLAPQWHGQGVAAKMMKNAKERAISLGQQRVWLKVMSKNERALSFYRKEGMEDIGCEILFDTVLRQRVEKTLMQQFL